MSYARLTKALASHLDDHLDNKEPELRVFRGNHNSDFSLSMTLKMAALYLLVGIQSVAAYKARTGVNLLSEEDDDNNNNILNAMAGMFVLVAENPIAILVVLGTLVAAGVFFCIVKSCIQCCEAINDYKLKAQVHHETHSYANYATFTAGDIECSQENKHYKRPCSPVLMV